ncbi:hypothetical protein EJ08DRAFT_732472 [Tothia fuscella]|uniref:RING-type domain-containing protein n=1 Tax=Tothia fuscella TaxID=1048955 RepID=A0A9P4NWE3_9PEZI|nr:hypothetical protein EJ08DRAFT_732472 [Tothia fuscella]
MAYPFLDWQPPTTIQPPTSPRITTNAKPQPADLDDPRLITHDEHGNPFPWCPHCHRRPTLLPRQLPCGHVYCNLCLQDVDLTARLINGIACCKACNFVITKFQPSVETRVEQMARQEQLRAVGPTETTTIGELVGEAQDNVVDFDRWFRASSVFQEAMSRPHPVGQQQQLLLQQPLQLPRQLPRQLPQMDPRMTGRLAQRRTSTSAQNPQLSIAPDLLHLRPPPFPFMDDATENTRSPYLPMPMGAPLPRNLPLPRNMPLDNSPGDGSFNNLSSFNYSFTNMDIPRLGRYNAHTAERGFGGLPLPSQVSRRTDTAIVGVPHDTTEADAPVPVSWDAVMVKWEGRRQDLTQGVETAKAEVEDVDAKVEKSVKLKREPGKGDEDG